MQTSYYSRSIPPEGKGCWSLFCIYIVAFPFTIYSQNIDLDLEPKKTIISRIEIVGNTILGRRQIKDLLVIGVDQEYDLDQLEIGLDQILTAYRQEGYGWTQIAVEDFNQC